jgi:transposase InsO family protein
VVQRQPAPGLLHHSDRGTPYTGEEYQATLAATGLAVSMSRRGDCWDNAVLESFFATLKTELVHEARWTTRAEADAASRPISRAGTIGGAGTQRWTT